MKFERLLSMLGDFGFHQKKMIFLLCLPAMTCCWHKFVWVFIGAIPAHRCWLPFEGEHNVNYTLPVAILNMSIPWDAGRNRWHQCRRLNATFNADYFERGVPSEYQVGCQRKYVFDTSRYLTSVPITWNLVCERMILPATTHSIFYIGVLLGSIGYGAMADKFGRRPALSVALATLSLAGLISGIVPDYFSFTAMRMVIGGSASGVFIVSLVIGMEMVGPSRRVLVGTAFQYFFAFGYLLLAVLAYLIRNWQSLQVAISAVGLLFISYYWIIPESARWLFQRQRISEAEIAIARIIRENNVTVPMGSLSAQDVANDDATSRVRYDGAKLMTGRFNAMHLFEKRSLRKKTFIVFFIWLVTSGVYYGLAIYTFDLGGNDYVNLVITAAIECLAYTIGLFTLDRYGRRPMLCGSLLLGGCVLLIIPLAAVDHSATVTFLAMMGRFGLASAYNVIYVFSVESFPTVVRCTGLGGSSAMARVGGIMSSYVLLLNVYWRPLPLIIFGALSTAACVLALQLPETAGKNLLETASDQETVIQYSANNEPSRNVEILRHSNGIL